MSLIPHKTPNSSTLDVSFAEAELARLREGSRVAITVLQGSFCPVTKAHILAITETRALLCGLPLQCPLSLAPGRPPPPPAADACIAVVVMTDQVHVVQTLLVAGETGGALPLSSRHHLVQLALRPYTGWAITLPIQHDIFDLLDALRIRYPKLSFVRYELLGADDFLTNPFRFESAGSGTAADSARLIILPRSPDPYHPDSVAVLAALGGDPHRWPYVSVGPALPPISSKQARTALHVRDVAALTAVCPPDVAAWLLLHHAPQSPSRAASGASPAAPGAGPAGHYTDL